MAGIDGYAGTTFRNITRGETVPISFTFTESDGITPIDVTGWKVYLVFHTALGASTVDLEVTLSPTDELNGVISGEISDTETMALAAGNCYAGAKYIKADGRSYIIDKAKIRIYEYINPRIEQS